MLASQFAHEVNNAATNGEKPTNRLPGWNGYGQGHVVNSWKIAPPTPASGVSDAVCSTVEAAKIAGCSRGVLLRWIRSGKIAAEKYGSTYVVNRESLRQFLDILRASNIPVTRRKRKNGSAKPKVACSVVEWWEPKTDEFRQRRYTNATEAETFAQSLVSEGVLMASVTHYAVVSTREFTAEPKSVAATAMEPVYVA